MQTEIVRFQTHCFMLWINDQKSRYRIKFLEHLFMNTSRFHKGLNILAQDVLFWFFKVGKASKKASEQSFADIL